MNTIDPAAKSALVTRLMVHDLMNLLTVALGHSELLALELDSSSPAHRAALDISEACRQAVEMVNGWVPPSN